VFFTDTGSVPWAEDAIENLAGLGIIKGVTDTLFMPGNTITKAEFAAMTVRAFKLETAPVGSLADVRYDKWYYREVMIAENFGIISGDAANRFYPETPITREEIAVMVFKALQASGRKFNVHDNTVLEKFIDKHNISPHAVSSMAVLAGEGIMEGLQGNTIGPKYPATRAQAAVFIYRALTRSEPGDEEAF
jgi:2',3'-cyclic-nucleotide 2'-phosphodiesterase/3'-nucleotidase/5'-nucleotidase